MLDATSWSPQPVSRPCPDHVPRASLPYPSRVPPDPLAAWRRRGANWKSRLRYENMTPLFQIHVARLAFELPCCSKIPTVCKIVARMVCPEKDISQMKYPTKEQVRLCIIKLDVLLALRQRRVFTMAGIRVARFLSPGSSPQVGYDYVNCLEERMIRPWPSPTCREVQPVW